MRQCIDGVLLLDKPLSMSSNRALQIAKRVYNAEKAGHTGTLDPLASGLLPVCFGEATKYASMMLEADKGYRAVLKLGQTTTTGDAEGEILETREVDVDARRVEAILAKFRGAIRQKPPMHSALKHKGKPLYAYARKGVEIERPERVVTILSLSMDDLSNEALSLSVLCSKGTYVRVLAEDIGNALGCGAHLKSLVRTATGPFDLADAHTLEEIEAREDRESLLLPCDALLQGFERMDFGEEDADFLVNGRKVEIEALPGSYRAYDASGCFIGLVEADNEGKIRPKRMMSGNFCLRNSPVKR